jgi:hypothetical protein
MSGAFTPGPWGLCESTDARNKGYIRPLGHEQIREDGSRPAVTRICTTGYRWAEWRANACLISAAPDGHALLIEMAAVLKAGGDFQRGPKGRHHNLLARLDAYFIKAEGRS